MYRRNILILPQKIKLQFLVYAPKQKFHFCYGQTANCVAVIFSIYSNFGVSNTIDSLQTSYTKKVVCLCVRYFVIKTDILVCATNNSASEWYCMQVKMLYVKKMAVCAYLDNHLFQEDAPCTPILIHIQKSSWLRPSECSAVYLSEFYTSLMNH